MISKCIVKNPGCLLLSFPVVVLWGLWAKRKAFSFKKPLSAEPNARLVGEGWGGYTAGQFYANVTYYFKNE